MIHFSTKLLKLFFFLILTYPAIIPAAPPGSVSLNCSTTQNGKAVVNEINTTNNFVEIYLLAEADISGWSIYLDEALVQNLGTGSCTVNGVATADNASGTTFPAGSFVVCYHDNNINPSNDEVLLLDKTGTPSGSTVIDYFGYGGLNPQATWSAPSACGTLYPEHAADNKDIARKPDGSGALIDNDDNSTPGTTNEPGGGGGDIAATDFNCVENGSNGISGKLYTKTTAQSFSFDIVALQDASTIETNFASGSDHTVSVELVDATSGASCSAYSALSSFPSNTITFTSGDSGTKASSSITPTSSKAYSAVKCRITDSTDSPSVVGCSTDGFSIRPTSYSLSSNQSNTGSTGTPKAKAGENFTLTATAVRGYTGTPSINTSKIEAHSGAIQIGSLSGSFSAADSSTGIATGSAFTYSEVGSLRFTAEGIYDSDFTVIDQSGDCTDDFSNTVVSGKVGCKFGNTTTSAYFGRFTPDHFALSNKSIENRVNLSCASASSFTYTGEAFQTGFTLTAQNSSNATTQNYTDSFTKLDNSVISNFNFGAIDLADATAPLSATALTSDLSLVSSSGSWSNGVATITASLGLTRTTPNGPFESFNLGIAPTDSDGIILSSYDLDTSSPSDSNDRELLATTKIRFGRLNIENAYGSELLALSVPFYTEYYNGTSFIKNTDDACTTVTISQLSFNSGSNPISIGSSTSTASIANSPLALGLAGLSLSAPGSGNTGDVDITSTNFISSFPWLAYDWDGNGSHDNSPSARATFGIYKGNSNQIYFREVY